MCQTKLVGMKSFVLICCTMLIAMFLYVVLSPLGEDEEKPIPESITVPLGLPPIPWPEDNPYSAKKAFLGRLLYFDKRLSSDATISCASCHAAKAAFTDHRPLAIGIDHRKGTRHSPTVINAGYQKLLFWDGRANSLEEQCKGPLANPNEMTDQPNVHDAHMQCEMRIRNIEGYKPLFAEVFGQGEITIDDIAKAVSTFERIILSGNSAYDRYMAGDKQALNEEQLRGMRLYKAKGCAHCHGGALFTDERFLNIGIGMDKPNPDVGRYGITHKDSDWGAFKVPTMREIENTYPYMHDGSMNTLEEVIDYYDRGGNPNKNLHPLMKPLHLTAADKKALISFLKALSGEGWEHYREPRATEFPK